MVGKLELALAALTPALGRRLAPGRRAPLLAALVALAAAAWLKRFYSQASAEELRWVLGPTAWLTGHVLGCELVFQPGAGYLSRELSVLIAPACAGVNFLIVAFLSLALGLGPRRGGARPSALWLAQAALAAYAATLVANSARIALSVALGHWAAFRLGLTFQSVHRLLGIAVYLAALLVLVLTFQYWRSGRAARAGRRGAPLLAVACYAAVTLLVPLLHGAAHNPAWWSHAAAVSGAVVVSAALLFAGRGRNWDDGRHAFRSPEHPDSEQGAGG